MTCLPATSLGIVLFLLPISPVLLVRVSLSIRHPIGPKQIYSWPDDCDHIVGELVIDMVFFQVMELASLVDTFIHKIVETSIISSI